MSLLAKRLLFHRSLLCKQNFLFHFNFILICFDHSLLFPFSFHYTICSGSAQQHYSTGYRVRFDPKRPREPDFEKKLLLAVMEPSFRTDSSPQSVKCAQKMQERHEKQKEIHPYVLLQADQCRQELESPFVYLFHINPTKSEELRKIKISMLKNEIHFRQYSIQVLETAMHGTRFSSLADILVYYGVFCFSHKNRLPFLNKLTKKHPNLILLGAIAENRVMNKEQLTEYTNLPSIDVLRAQLCHTLSTPSTAIHSSLGYHLTDLSSSLQRRASSEEKKEE